MRMSGVGHVAVAAPVVDVRLFVVGGSMRQASDGAATFDGHDPAQRALEVRLVLHVEPMELLRRHHLLQPRDLLVEQVLLGAKTADRLFRIQVATAQRIDLVGDRRQQPVDSLGAFAARSSR